MTSTTRPNVWPLRRGTSCVWFMYNLFCDLKRIDYTLADLKEINVLWKSSNLVTSFARDGQVTCQPVNVVSVDDLYWPKHKAQLPSDIKNLCCGYRHNVFSCKINQSFTFRSNSRHMQKCLAYKLLAQHFWDCHSSSFLSSRLKPTLWNLDASFAKKNDNCHALWQNYICKSNAPFLRTPASLPSLIVLPPWRQDHKRTPITRECTLQPNWTLTTASGSSWTTGKKNSWWRGSHRGQHDKAWTQHFMFSLSLSHFSYACVVQQLLRRRKCLAYKKEGGGDECARRMF